MLGLLILSLFSNGITAIEMPIERCRMYEAEISAKYVNAGPRAVCIPEREVQHDQR